MRRRSYFSNAESLSTIEKNLPIKFPDDEKSKLFLSLGQKTWDKVLEAIISEPGTSKGVVINEQQKLVSLGGWADPLPVQVRLKSFVAA